MGIKEYLSRPAQPIDKPWVIVILNTVGTGLILAIFEPFHYILNSMIQLWVLWTFISIAFTTSALGFVITPRLFKQFYTPEYWTVGKKLVHCMSFLFLTGVIAFIYDYFFLIRVDPWSDEGRTFFFKFLGIDMVAGITILAIPLIIGLFVIENSNLKRNLQEADKLNQRLSERVKQEDDVTDTVTLLGDTKDSIVILPEKILYMESSGNYVDICYLEESKVKHKLLRSTVKQMEEAMQAYSSFIRCHRAYIVNINHITNIGGNAQGYRLSLSGLQQEIPVSRTYLKNFKSFLD